jgi:3-methyladenine DNA glycosylase AlkD
MSAIRLTAEDFLRELQAFASPARLKGYETAFPVRRRQPDDVFIGVRMGDVFKLAKTYIAMPLDEIEKLMESQIHEGRVGAVSIMDFQARDKKTPASRRKELFDLYIRRHDRISSWDLVDRSAFYVVGSYLADKPRDILYKLARSSSAAERRTAIVSTGQFAMKLGQTDDTFRIAEMLLDDEDDLIHKATGWMLRVAGDIDRDRLLEFLDQHAPGMPAVMLSYATEKLDRAQKDHYRGLRTSAKRRS